MLDPDMKYKAIMVDIDGTLVAYNYNSLPTKRVQDAVRKASAHVTVCVTTGRSYPSTEPIVQSLNLHNGLAIVNNGAQVLDLGEKKVLYEKVLEPNDEEVIVQYLKSHNINFHINSLTKDPKGHKEYYPKGLTKIFTEEIFTEEEADRVIADLSHIPTITLTKGMHRDPHLFSIAIGHAEATKQHGIQQVAAILGVSTHEIIGIGDGYNDFPLLMACGLKVAMGNAVPDLKAIADYVAPSVDEDGVADVIEKYILNN